MTTDVVEAVARAICIADGYPADDTARANPIGGGIIPMPDGQYRWMDYEHQAKAAIAAHNAAVLAGADEGTQEIAQKWERIRNSGVPDQREIFSIAEVDILLMEIKALRTDKGAKIARLREALTDIERHAAGTEDASLAAQTMGEIARAALKDDTR